MILFLLLALLTLAQASGVGSSARKQRCRSTDDLGRIPWFLPNSTFHNFGFPLIRTLCDTVTRGSSSYDLLGCFNATNIEYLYESEHDLRYGNRSSTIIVDPHMMEGPNSASSGTYVIMAMFEILYGLGYNPGVRHWSEPMSGMFPPDVAAAATDISRRYEASVQGKGENPYSTMGTYIMLQIEVPFGFVATVPVNPSPYIRTFNWIIGLHQSHNYKLYHTGDPAAHCSGANFFLSRARMCSTSGVIPCPQYQFHRTRSYEVTPETRASMKKNIILFDNDQDEIDMNRLRVDVMKLGGLDDLQVYHNSGRKKTDMPDLYKQVKMTIDCRNPGVEFINYEATLYDVMTLSCDMRATRNVFDFPVPSKYHINSRNWTQFVSLVHDSLINYEQRIDDFKHFKRLSRSSSQLAKAEVDVHYFSRDVMFRTFCGSYGECRRVYPWAVAVWTLYPMAMIEVVTDMDIQQELLDNDLVRITLSDLLTSKYFRMYNGAVGMAAVDAPPRTPSAYMVYMDPSFIPFGRDFLNTHVAALVKDPRPIVYWQEDKLAIAVMHARPYAKILREPAGAKSIYIETEFAIRPVADRNVHSEMLKVFGGATDTLESGYLSRLPNGAPFTLGDLQELIRKNPPLLSEPCDAGTTAVSNVLSVDSALTSSNTSSVASVETTSLRRRTTVFSGTVHRQPQVHVSPSHQIVPSRTHPILNPATAAAASTVDSAQARTSQAPHHHQHHHHQHHNRHDSALRPRCTPPDHLIIDALYIPMPRVGERAQENALWLTSSLPPVSVNTVLDTFTKTQIETVVQHLDPILYNTNMRKIISLMPAYIADAFKLFDAVDHPDVISLRDMEYTQWGEVCA